MKKLLVGLGNPGKKYENSRHNVGFMIIDHLVQERGLVWEKNKKIKGELVKGKDYFFLKPGTYMNLSGEAVRGVRSYFKFTAKDLYLIHDDVDIEPFTFKLQFGKEAAGHHGVEDIIKHLKTNQFWRIRVGIGRPESNSYDIEDWVLTNFSYDEHEKILKLAEDIDQKLNQH